MGSLRRARQTARLRTVIAHSHADATPRTSLSPPSESCSCRAARKGAVRSAEARRAAPSRRFIDCSSCAFRAFTPRTFRPTASPQKPPNGPSILQPNIPCLKRRLSSCRDRRTAVIVATTYASPAIRRMSSSTVTRLPQDARSVQAKERKMQQVPTKNEPPPNPAKARRKESAIRSVLSRRVRCCQQSAAYDRVRGGMKDAREKRSEAKAAAARAQMSFMEGGCTDGYPSDEASNACRLPQTQLSSVPETFAPRVKRPPQRVIKKNPRILAVYGSRHATARLSPACTRKAVMCAHTTTAHGLYV